MNGTVSQNQVAAVYKCSKHHLLSGGMVRTCNKDGTWGGIQPSCPARKYIEQIKTLCINEIYIIITYFNHNIEIQNQIIQSSEELWPFFFQVD